MPRIFDNINESLLPALQETLAVCDRADFCVGYFNLRGWRELHDYVERWPGGEGNCCRLLVGMQALPEEDFRAAMSLAKGQARMDNATALRMKKTLAEEFRNQLGYFLFQLSIISRARSLPPRSKARPTAIAPPPKSAATAIVTISLPTPSYSRAMPAPSRSTA